MTKTAVIYLRVSTERQARRGGGSEGFSIPAQREACLRKAEDLGAEVVGEYLDAGESARSADRPQLQQMLSDLRTSVAPADFVIVHKLDRLARNRGDDVAINLAIREAGAALVSCTEQIDATPTGALMHTVFAGFAEYYSNNLAVEVKKGQLQKARTGGTPGRVPPGYLNTRQILNGQEIRTVEIDPERAPHIEWMFKAYATGEYTLSELTAELESRGCKSRQTPKMPSKPFSRSQVHRYLSNKYYVGVVHYSGVDYEGNHPALIDLDTFRTVQAVLKTNRTAGDRAQHHQHYLKGSLWCGGCGAKMALTHSKGRSKVYTYFYCLGRNKKRTDCQQGSVGIARAEQAVEEHYRGFQFDPAWIEATHTAIRNHIELTQTLNVKEVERQTRRLAKLDRERRKLLQAYYDDALPADLLREEQDRIATEQRKAEKLIASCTAEYERMNRNLDRAIDKITNLHVTYRISDDEGRRKINQGFFEKLFIVEDGVSGSDLAAPYAQLLDADLEGRIRAEQQLSAEELFKTDDTTNVEYEAREETDNEVAARLLSQIDWHPWERPHGPMPVDKKNPAAYERRRGSNLTLLAEGGGFEPPGPVKAHWFSRPTQSSALPSFRQRLYRARY